MNEYKCPKCGTEFSLGARFCQKCGCDFVIEFMDKPAESKKLNSKYPKASFGNRLLAYIIDRLIIAGLAIPAIVFLVIGRYISGWYDWHNIHFYGEGFLFFMIAAFCFLLPLAYFFVKDGLGKGQSLGKRSVGIMVVYLPTGTPCTIGQSCVRALIWQLLRITVIGKYIELILVIVSEDGRRLADFAANTQVIDVTQFQNK